MGKEVMWKNVEVRSKVVQKMEKKIGAKEAFKRRIWYLGGHRGEQDNSFVDYVDII